MIDMVIHRARATDVAALLEMMASFNASEGIVWDATQAEQALRHLLGDPNLGFALVATMTETSAGYAVAAFNFDLEFAGRDAFVTELFVRTPHRRAGVARGLLAAVEATARNEGAHALHVLALPDNRAALTLYEETGFERSPRVILTKRIDSGAR